MNEATTLTRPIRVLLLLSLGGLLRTFGSTVLASGSSTSSLPSQGDESAFDVTENFKCELLELYENGVIRVRQESDGEERMLQLTDKPVVKAQNKARFGGRKKLSLEDLQVGHRLSLTRRVDKDLVVKIKVIESKG